MIGPGATVLVFTGGESVPLGALDDVDAAAFVIAADSGIEAAVAHGRHVDLAVGDFDSVASDVLERVSAEGAILERHPTSKDKTDLELALDAAVFRRPARLVLAGGHGGRIDHFVGNVSVLLADAYGRPGMRVEARMGSARLFVVRERVELVGRPGQLVSLLALTRTVTGITTEGLRYPLDDEALHPGSSRGVSNELISTEASVRVGDGALLVIQPGDE